VTRINPKPQRGLPVINTYFEECGLDKERHEKSTEEKFRETKTENTNS